VVNQVRLARPEDRLQNHPAVGEESHEKAEEAAQDRGREFVVADVHSYKYEAFDGQDCGSEDRQRRLPMECGGDDESDRADELQDAKDHPDFSRQRAKRWNVLAYPVENEDLHDAGRSVQ